MSNIKTLLEWIDAESEPCVGLFFVNPKTGKLTLVSKKPVSQVQALGNTNMKSAFKFKNIWETRSKSLPEMWNFNYVPKGRVSITTNAETGKNTAWVHYSPSMRKFNIGNDIIKAFNLEDCRHEFSSNVDFEDGKDPDTGKPAEIGKFVPPKKQDPKQFDFIDD